MLVQKSGRYVDIRSLKVTINNYNVTNAALNIEIFQDIFTPCWSSIITMEDSSNMLSNIPIIVGAKVSIQVDTKTDSMLDGNKNYSFVVYKIGDKKMKRTNAPNV